MDSVEGVYSAEGAPMGDIEENKVDKTKQRHQSMLINKNERGMWLAEYSPFS